MSTDHPVVFLQPALETCKTSILHTVKQNIKGLFKGYEEHFRVRQEVSAYKNTVDQTLIHSFTHSITVILIRSALQIILSGRHSTFTFQYIAKHSSGKDEEYRRAGTDKSEIVELSL